MAIYVDRGLDPSLARQVAEQLRVHDALGAHARDELGISETFRARPIQAALASAASFAVGAVIACLCWSRRRLRERF
jgi:vacuolar iron transporter family protein